MSLSDIFNFIWNMNLFWVLLVLIILVCIYYIIRFFEKVSDVITEFSSNKYPFYIRIAVISVILFFLILIYIL
jgi:hypothetical protein